MKQNYLRVALITGAGRRIGAAIAELMHQSGFRVAIHCYLSVDEANALCARLNQLRPDSAYVLMAPLTQKKDVVALIPRTIEWAGRLDVLINNASIFKPSIKGAASDELWNALFTINVQAPYWLSIAAQTELSKQEGVIINITDIHADSPLKGYAEYCQSKAALNMQTKALAQAFAPEIRVNAIAPGAILWPEGPNSLTAIQQDKIIEKTLLKKHGNPAFIAQAVLALVENPFITGQILRVDGGRAC